MKYKFKEGDKVKLAKGIRIRTAGIELTRKDAGLIGELTIEDDTPGDEGWISKKNDGQPTYTINMWRIPESFLVPA